MLEHRQQNMASWKTEELQRGDDHRGSSKINGRALSILQGNIPCRGGLSLQDPKDKLRAQGALSTGA